MGDVGIFGLVQCVKANGVIFVQTIFIDLLYVSLQDGINERVGVLTGLCCS